MDKAIFFILQLSIVIKYDVKSEGIFELFHHGYEEDSNSQKSKQTDGQHTTPAPASSGLIERRLIPYSDGNETFTGYLAYNKFKLGQRPAVLVVHDWDGRDEFENGKADALAKLGYAGFALDLYGRNPSTTTEIRELMKPFTDNRQFLLKRLQLAMDELRKLQVVDKTKFGAIGFCFGGMAVLDMARAGWDLKGVVSFHGSLGPPPIQQDGPVKAKVLVLHGHDDPGNPPSAVQALEQEFTKRKADWQVHVYSNTVHAFTVPTANSSSAMYNPLSDKRSWLAMKNFFEEVFA